MLVPTSRIAEVLAVAKQTAELITVGDPTGDAILGPVVSSTQWSLVLGYEGINQAIEISNDTIYGLAASSACAFHLSVVDAIVHGVVWVSHHKHDSGSKAAIGEE
jgi:acyl-CoA reductase-like NAD-dependent aldehyde dehydrogenase